MEHTHIPYSTSTLPPARRVLVLAPHPDDEIFGCGGSLALYRQTGTEISVHVLTDGAGFAAEAQRKAVQEVRQSETNGALASLGIPPATFGSMPDRSLSDRVDLVQYVTDIIQNSSADVIFAPSLWEIHPDHLATSRAAWNAVIDMQRLGAKVPTLLFYEVGSPQRPDLLVDITAVWPQKQRAIQCFPSQLALQDYARHMRALNIFRTYTLPESVRYAEALGHVDHEQLSKMAQLRSDQGSRAIKKWLKVAANTSETETETETLQIAYASQVQDLQRLHAILHATERELDESRRINRQMLNSNSWRMTAVLRWLRRILKQQD